MTVIKAASRTDILFNKLKQPIEDVWEIMSLLERITLVGRLLAIAATSAARGFVVYLVLAGNLSVVADRPNILWIVGEDHGGSVVAAKGLAELAPRDRNNVWVSLAALTDLDDCGNKAISLRDAFPTWPTSGETIDERYGNSHWKMMKSIKLRFGLAITKPK